MAKEKPVEKPAEKPDETPELPIAAAAPVVGLTADALTQILTKVGDANAEGMRRSLRRENPHYREVSVFLPAGVPKPTLRRDVLFCGMKQHDDQLTPEEITLYNRFEGSKEARGGLWAAQIARKGTREVLSITLPIKDLSNRMDLPDGLTLILRELLDGADAINPTRLTDEVAALKAQVAALTAAMTSQPRDATI